MMLSSKHFIMKAKSAFNSKTLNPYIEKVLHEANDNYGVSGHTVDQLLDMSNWRSDEPPRVRIDARMNRAGNLIVEWQPTIRMSVKGEEEHLDFKPDFLARHVNINEAIGHNRPPAELMWFRDFATLVSYSSQSEEYQAPLLDLLWGIQARYVELVNQVRLSIKITSATELALTEEENGKIVFTLKDQSPSTH